MDIALFKLTSICSAQDAPFGMLSLRLHKSFPDLFALVAAGKGPQASTQHIPFQTLAAHTFVEYLACCYVRNASSNFVYTIFNVSKCSS